MAYGDETTKSGQVAQLASVRNTHNNGVAFVITGKLDFAIEIGLLDTSIKFVTYFAHERVWVRIPYGRPKETAAQEPS